jgi:hypothetical protein
MLAKLIQAATITFVLHLLMGLSATKTAQVAPLAIGQSSPSQAALQLSSSKVAE